MKRGWYRAFVGNRALARDADGDGLSDLVEARLGLDPRKADTDGDGDRDEVDPMPNAPWRRLNDEEAAIAAAFEARHAGPEGWPGPGRAATLLMPAGIRPFEMVGWYAPLIWATNGPLNTCPPIARFKEEGWESVVLEFGSPPIRWNAARTEGELWLSLASDDFGGDGYYAKVRRSGRWWIVTALVREMIYN